MADPAKNYPSVFGESVFFKEHPYLLPNVVCTGFVLLGLTVGFLFLQETHEDKRDRTDVGLILGRQLLRAVPCIGSSSEDSTAADEARCYADDEKGDYLAIPTSPQITATTATASNDSTGVISEKVMDSEVLQRATEPKVSFYKSLTRQIKFIIVSYGLLAL